MVGSAGGSPASDIGDLLSDDEFGEKLQVGAGDASLAWRVGAKPGQVGTGAGTSANRKPYPYSTIAAPGEGIHGEPTAKAVVLESDGKRYALVKADAYLMHEYVHRRVSELIADLGIPRERLLVSSTHNHSAPHATSTGAGVSVIATDAFDIRHWSYQTRQLANAVERAVESLEPATVRAVEGTFDAVQQNIIGPATATEKATEDGGPLDARNQGDYDTLTDEDGDPIRAGFPPDHTEDQFVILRFDTPDGDPIASTVTMGMHPESLAGGHGLTTSEFVGMLERRLEDHVGGDFLAAFLNGALGDIEPSRGDAGQPDWWRESFGRLEEMAEAIVSEAIRLYDLAGEAEIPDGDGPPADSPHGPPDDIPRGPPGNSRRGDETSSGADDRSADTRRTAGPHTRPQKLEEGEETVLAYGRRVDVGMSSLRLAPPEGEPGPTTSTLSQEAGSGLDMPSTGAAQESASPFLTAFALGEVLFASFPGEPISDVSFNFRTRVVEGFDEVYQGYHWSSNPDWVRERVAKNFAETTVDEGYEIAALLSITNAWQGYFVTRWEYENRNHYRESLTPYGPDSADHVNTALVDMAAELRGDGTAESRLSAVEAADSGRREATYRALVAAEESSVHGFRASIPPAGEGVGDPIAQPGDVERFETATFSWVGGSNAVDLPRVILQRRAADGWVDVADSREHGLVVSTDQPPLQEDTEGLTAREREWTATWEVPWDAEFGEYRFQVTGTARGTPGSSDRTFFDPTGADTDYEAGSESFAIGGGTIPFSEPYTNLSVDEGRVSGRIAFEAPFRASDRPADGTAIPVSIVGETTTRTTGVYEVDGVYLDDDVPMGSNSIVIEEGAYVDSAGNPTERVELSL